MILLLLYITFKSQLAAKEEINQLQKTQLDNLAVYTEEIEKMYQTLRGFRHDYQNVLLSLQESIDSEDIEQIKQVYHDILASADVRLVRQIESTNVNELANIHDSAVKSVMFWKITQARDRKVVVDVEIKEEISQLWMSSLHFIRIFSILMDNAIEEAKRTVTPKISIALFVNQGDIIFIVSNSTLLTSVNINQLKKPGYTTKGKNRGIGLSNVDEILTQYSNCYLETELENGVFTQRLVMEGIEE
ncbi:sensor histidine kinase [Enterococcus cecorum]|uniref:sensor histidine kinase n=1 Tax=Enterococcus cecorum TaxID=44008 RepID=UPI00200B9BC2|nr:GHKL domain-containing protein [Enterococcus cecorum]